MSSRSSEDALITPQTKTQKNARVETIYAMWMAWGGNVFHANPWCSNAQKAEGGRWVTNENGDWRPCSQCMIPNDHPYVEEYYE